MRILITLAKTDILGGSVIWAYTVSEELIKRGHEVFIKSARPGRNHHRFTKLGVKDCDGKEYDLILGNHLSLFHNLKGRIVNVCHGTIVELEQPDPRADKYISISKEVQDHLKDKGMDSTVIMNPVNLERFKPKSEGEGILSLAQGDIANNMLQDACDRLGVDLVCHNKYKGAVWDLWNEIPKYKAVISLGRGVYESLACDKPVIVLDSRGYTPTYGDGLLTTNNYEQSKAHNCSGRGFKYPVTVAAVMGWVNSALRNREKPGVYRSWAERDFDVKLIVDKLLEV